MTKRDVERAYEKLAMAFYSGSGRADHYLSELLDTCKAEERGHRGFGEDFAKYHPGAPSVTFCAKLFAVKRIAEYIREPDRAPRGKEYLHTQRSCFNAAGIAEEFRNEILKAWQEFDYLALVGLDYCDFMRAQCPATV